MKKAEIRIFCPGTAYLFINAGLIQPAVSRKILPEILAPICPLPLIPNGFCCYIFCGRCGRKSHIPPSNMLVGKAPSRICNPSDSAIITVSVYSFTCMLHKRKIIIPFKTHGIVHRTGNRHFHLFSSRILYFVL